MRQPAKRVAKERRLILDATPHLGSVLCRNLHTSAPARREPAVAWSAEVAWNQEVTTRQADAVPLLGCGVIVGYSSAVSFRRHVTTIRSVS